MRIPSPKELETMFGGLSGQEEDLNCAFCASRILDSIRSASTILPSSREVEILLRGEIAAALSIGFALGRQWAEVQELERIESR